jgi:hypothetical protein
VTTGQITDGRVAETGAVAERLITEGVVATTARVAKERATAVGVVKGAIYVV